MYDKALCGFGAGRQGLDLQNQDLERLFLPAVRVRTDRTGQMVALAGWWSIYFPWDIEASLHYRPVELVWFLLKHINSPSRVAQPKPLSPLRFSIASLVMLPWEDLINWCAEFGGLDRFPQEGGVIRGFHWMPEPTSVSEHYSLTATFSSSTTDVLQSIQFTHTCCSHHLLVAVTNSYRDIPDHSK